MKKNNIKSEIKLDNPYALLGEGKNRITLIVISSIYIFFFLLIFNPLGFNNGFSSVERFLRILSFAPKWALIIALNEFVIRKLFLSKIKWKWHNSIAWFLWEALSLGAGTMIIDYLLINAYYRAPEFIIGWIFQQAWIYLFPFAFTYICIKYRDSVTSIRKQNDNLNDLVHITDSKLTIKGRNKAEILSICIKDLLYIEAKGNYIHVNYYGQDYKLKKYLIRSTMKEILDQLSSFRIIRIHRSYLVNYFQIEKFERNNGKIIASLKNNLELPVSDMYFKQILSSGGFDNKKTAADSLRKDRWTERKLHPAMG